MKLSIFPKAKPLPQSKAEKNKETKYVSRPYLPEICLVDNEDDLIRIVTNYAWSPNVFSKARLKDDFISTDFLVLDIDDDLTIPEALEVVESANITCLCLPTTSHKEEHHKFRLIFPLVRTITNRDEYIATMELLVENFPQADPKCTTDFARFYFGCREDDGFWFDGELLAPETVTQKPKKGTLKDFNPTDRVRVTEELETLVESLYGAKKEFIPEAVSYFMTNAHTGLKGEWTCSLNAFIFTLALQGLDYDVIYQLTESLAPSALDSKDKDVISRAFKDGEEVFKSEQEQ